MMKPFKYKLPLLFILTLSLIIGISILFRIEKEKQFNIKLTNSKLSIYADYTEYFLSQKDTQSIKKLLPNNLRLSLISSDGNLFFDNIVNTDNNQDNHLSRPEIMMAHKNGVGYSIRRSESANVDYLFYAKLTNQNYYIRVALPHVVSFTDFMERENMLIDLLLFSLIATLLILLILTGKFEHRSRKMMQLNDKERKRTQKIKQEMTNNIAHELKTPVTSIRGYLEILNENQNIDPKQRNFYLERAYSQVIRLSDLISDISIITKLEESSTLFTKEQVNIYSIIEEAHQELMADLSSNHIQFNNNIKSDTSIIGNHNLLYSIFRNLIENSIKYAGENISININCLNKLKNGYQIEFYDTGKGIKESQLEIIFDRFVRLDEGRTRKSGGTGLGLSIVKHAIIYHNGEISAHNYPQGGLQFIFTLKQ